MYITEKGRLVKENLSFEDALKETAADVGSVEILTRLEESIEKEGKAMRFKNERHRKLFTAVSRHMNRKDNRLMCGVYLLTADMKLWRVARPYVSKNYIAIGKIPVKVGSDIGYNLLCSAKDLMTGTKYLTADDLANRTIITPKLFKVICTAMTIRRYGLEILRFEMEEDRQ